MKNGHRARRWRIWHQRRAYRKSSTLDRINCVTVNFLHDPECQKLMDSIFRQSPLFPLLDETYNETQRGR